MEDNVNIKIEEEVDLGESIQFVDVSVNICLTQFKTLINVINFLFFL